MAKRISKGTILRQDIATVMTAVAQVLSVSHDGAENETFDCTTLDTSGAGKEYMATGYSEGGTVGFELYFDSALAGHQSLTDHITTPAERAYDIQLVGGTAMAFTAAGIGFGFSVDMADGVKASVSLKLDQLMTYQT